jgi:hypothetical protein
MTTTAKHDVSAVRDGRFWLVSVDGALATQALRFKDIETMARDWIATTGDLRPEDVEMEVSVVVPDDVRTHLDRARELRDESARLRTEAGRESAAAVHRLRDLGLTVREIAGLLDISFQRVHQLTAVEH